MFEVKHILSIDNRLKELIYTDEYDVPIRVLSSNSRLIGRIEYKVSDTVRIKADVIELFGTFNIVKIAVDGLAGVTEDDNEFSIHMQRHGRHLPYNYRTVRLDKNTFDITYDSEELIYYDRLNILRTLFNKPKAVLRG